MVKEDSKFCNCLYFSANALARVMTQIAEEAFAPTGLSPSYGYLIMTVVDTPGIQPTEISKQMQLTPSTITRLIEKMEQKGLLLRKTVGRTTEVYPTENGLALVPELKTCWKNLYLKYTETLGEDTAKKLTRIVYQSFKALEP